MWPHVILLSRRERVETQKVMRITNIDTYQLSTPIEPGFGWSQGWNTERRIGLVKITTDDGLVGWGEGASGPSATVIEEIFTPLLLGADPLNRVGLWQRLFHTLYNDQTAGGFGGNALSAVDIALWDLAGKATGLSVAELLGGRVREKVAVYATGLYYTDDEFPDKLLEEARGYVEAGFRGMKTKVGGLSVAQDIERITLLRDAIGPEIELMIDANQAYNATTAIRIGEELADLDLRWFEEPVNARDIEGYLQVQSALPMAIAGGECLRTRYEFAEFFSRRALDIAQPDVMHVGGITELRNVATAANAFGVQVNPHVWGSPVMIAASLHLASTFPPCPPARDPQPYAQEPVMEFDRTPSEIREELCAEPFDQKDGFITVPTGPGLGIEVDEKALERWLRR